MTEPTKSKEMWKDHEKQMKIVYTKRCFKFLKEIKGLENEGIEVIEIQHRQYRLKVKTAYVNEELDIFPARKTYHDRIRNIRGKIEGDFRSFIRQFFGIQ